MNDTATKLVIGAILGGLVTLALNFVRIITTSVIASQKTRIELLRSALEGFNSATYTFALIGREQGFVMAREDLNLDRYDEDRRNMYVDQLDEGMRQLSNSMGYCLAIGYSNMGESMRKFQDMVFDNMGTIENGADADAHSDYKAKFNTDLRCERDKILNQFEVYLKEEAKLSTAFSRYFGS